jgi:hypothetical protein
MEEMEAPMTKRALTAIWIALLLLPAVGLAQAPEAKPAPATPQEVLLTTVELTKKGDWAGFARIMHPEALADLRRMFRPLVEAGTEQIGKPFFGIESIKEFDALSDPALFERFMSNLTKLPGVAEALGSAEASVIGTVEEAPDLAHVVYRGIAKAEGVTVSKTNVITLRRANGEWKALLNGSIEGMAARLAAVVGAEDPEG